MPSSELFLLPDSNMKSALSFCVLLVARQQIASILNVMFSHKGSSN